MNIQLPPHKNIDAITDQRVFSAGITPTNKVFNADTVRFIGQER